MSSPRYLQGDHDGKWCKNRIQNIGLLEAILGVLFIIAGIILLCTYVHNDINEIIIDYTDCKPSQDPSQKKCKDAIIIDEDCSCYIPINFNITQPMKAPVTAFYELDSYDQIINNYSQSRDDNQLAGHLSSTPANSCGNYTYADTAQGKMPIAPCGQLADAMFNDTYSLKINNDYVPTLRTGLISEDDKKQFHNPSGNLSEAFKSFSKPLNWKKNAWELDTKNPKNNGFENEAFIIWMKTDLKRKPVFRVNHNIEHYEHGFPVGNYTLRVVYRYPTSRYDGRRKFILISVQKVVNYVSYGIGVALLVMGLMMFIFAAILIWRSLVLYRH